MDYKRDIAARLAAQTQLPEEELLTYLETPPNRELGDYAFPCFKLAKHLRKAPPAIAGELAAALERPSWWTKVEQVGGYLNFFLDRSAFAGDAVEAVLAQGARYGGSDEGAGRVVCIDYSSINIAKRFHIAHLSSTAIGAALYRIYAFLGYKPVGINHLGDWGTQFGKMIAAYKRWGSEEQVEQGGVDALTELYVRFHQEAEKNKALEDEGRAWFKRIEDGDEEALRIFNWFKELTMRDAMRVYDLLGVHFDSYAGESFYNDKMGQVVDELKAKNLLVESDGAQVVTLEDVNMTPCIIVKRDGATIYATRDIAAALYRKETYDFYKCLYVVAYQQNLHFQKWFNVVRRMGYDWYKDLEHVAFGMVSFEGQALSTRNGRIVYLEDLLDRAVQNARKIIDEKSPGLEDKDGVAKQVGVGAVVFWNLYNNRIKDIDFYWDRVLNFEGETGPYVQYTHARCMSVLAKAGPGAEEAPDYAALQADEAMEVVGELSRFPEVVREACQRNEPSMVTRYTVDLAQAFNRFYYEHRILDDNRAATAARLRLARAVAQVLRNGLGLIGVEAPVRM